MSLIKIDSMFLDTQENPKVIISLERIIMKRMNLHTNRRIRSSEATIRSNTTEVRGSAEEAAKVATTKIRAKKFMSQRAQTIRTVRLIILTLLKQMSVSMSLLKAILKIQLPYRTNCLKKMKTKETTSPKTSPTTEMKMTATAAITASTIAVVVGEAAAV